MLTLSKATSLTRTVLKWIAILVSSFLLLLIVIRIYSFIKDRITPPPPPTVSFGKLPAIDFPNSKTSKEISYSIDTVTGSLPVFPDRIDVFEIAEPTPDLLALEKTEKKISPVGFRNDPIQISETIYQWLEDSSNSALSRKIIFDTLSGNFNMSSAYLSDSQVLSANNLPNQTAALNIANNFLSNMDVLPQDIDLDKTQTSIFSIDKGTLIPATSLSKTQIMKVSFFQKDLNNLKIVYPTPDSSTINVFVAGGQNSPQVVKIDFFHQNIASSSATYPIVSSNEAFDKLKNGDTYIASLNEKSSKVSINKVSLAYYLSDKPQKYAMPVVVFEGNDGFTAYVSAIQDEWIQK